MVNKYEKAFNSGCSQRDANLNTIFGVPNWLRWQKNTHYGRECYETYILLLTATLQHGSLVWPTKKLQSCSVGSTKHNAGKTQEDRGMQTCCCMSVFWGLPLDPTVLAPCIPLVITSIFFLKNGYAKKPKTQKTGSKQPRHINRRSKSLSSI